MNKPFADSPIPEFKPRYLANGEEVFGQLKAVEHAEEFMLVTFGHEEIVIPYNAELETALGKLVGGRASILRLGKEHFCGRLA